MKTRRLVWTSVGLLFLALLAGNGCKAAAKTAADDASVAQAREAHAGGALLWEQNCSRCHNYRNPRSRSDREWQIILHHMRVRANLTAVEHREIRRFLRAAN